MRVTISPIKAVKVGDEVICRVTNTRNVKHSRVSIWSAMGGFEFSPHLPIGSYDLITEKPHPIKPLCKTLKGENAVCEFKFIADEKMKICVMQDIELKDDPTAKAKVTRYGKTYQKIRRYFRNFPWYTSSQDVENSRIG